jgi:hypothetical protein
MIMTPYKVEHGRYTRFASPSPTCNALTTHVDLCSALWGRAQSAANIIIPRSLESTSLQPSQLSVAPIARSATADEVDRVMKEQGVDSQLAEELANKEIRQCERTSKQLRASKRRKTDEQSHMNPHQGESSVWQTATRVCRATTTLVWQGFQNMMQGLPGIMSRARTEEMHFADIKDPRVANAVRAGAYRFFCKDDACSFIADLAERLPEEQRQSYVEQVLTRFRREGSIILKRADIRQVGSSCIH